MRLYRERPEYLAEGNSHERIVDAAPVRDEQRHQRAGQSCYSERRGHAYPEICDNVELTEAERVSADPEIGAMAERRQSGRTEHEIERQRVERPDQDFDAEIRIEPDARDPQRHRRQRQKQHQHGRRDQPRQVDCWVGIISGLEHAFLAPEATRPNGYDRHQQHVHRQQRPF